MSTDILSLKMGVTSSYLLRGTSGIVMIDTGMPDKMKLFVKKIRSLHILPHDIKLVILTHSHIDHAGSAKEIQELTGAQVMIHKSEKECLEKCEFYPVNGTGTWGRISKQIFFPFLKRIKYSAPRIDIETGDEDFPLSGFGIDGYVMHTPGHTPGSVSVILNTGEAFVGCMSHSGFPFRTTPGLPLYASDIEKLKLSWKKLFEKGVKIIFPGHGKPFPAGIMRKRLASPEV